MASQQTIKAATTPNASESVKTPKEAKHGAKPVEAATGKGQQTPKDVGKTASSAQPKAEKGTAGQDPTH